MGFNFPSGLAGKNLKSSADGFTLVEILIVIFVVALLLGAFFTLFEWHSKIYRFQQAMVRVSGSGRASLQALDLYGRQAYRVLVSRDFSGTVYASGPDCLVLQLPAIDNSGEVLPGKWDYLAFYRDGDKFYQLADPDPASNRVSLPKTKLLSDTLSSLSFVYDNGDYALVRKVSAEIVTSLNLTPENVSSSLRQNIYLKNH